MTETTEYRGYRGVVPLVEDLLARLAKTPEGTHIQLLRADRVHGVDHLRTAVLHADRAFARGENVASAWPLEVLRYAAGARQINRALDLLGLAPGEGTVAAVVRGDPAVMDALADDLGWTRDDEVLDGDEASLDALGVDARQRAMVPEDRWDELVLEVVAVADVR